MDRKKILAINIDSYAATSVVETTEGTFEFEYLGDTKGWQKCEVTDKLDTACDTDITDILCKLDNYATKEDYLIKEIVINKEESFAVVEDDMEVEYALEYNEESGLWENNMNAVGKQLFNAK